MALNIGSLLCSPVVAIAKGQAALTEVFLSQLKKIAWENGESGGEVNTLDFNVERTLLDDEGKVTYYPVEIKAPLISLVPVPAFTMKKATVKLTLAVTDQRVSQDKVGNTAETGSDQKEKAGEVIMTGFVVGNKDKGDPTLTVDIEMEEHATTEGMKELNKVLAAIINPVNVEKTQKSKEK
jgi:hypothetical protein